MFKSHIKLAVLAALSKSELSGYDLMREVANSTSKRPSAGYMYPLLSELQKRNFVSMKAAGRRKVYRLTAKGKKLLKDLKRTHDTTVQSLQRTLAPIAERGELERFLSFKKRAYNYKQHLAADLDLFEQLHDTLFKIYDSNDSRLRKRMRMILKKSIAALKRL
ncbi:MAG: PadR family transcriptional regulator [Nanoarchaeota archaeon]|nr:MAG: PadR family transcriptional regulator [Nanoarchaeota archaeon]